MDIDGYNGSELANLESNVSLLDQTQTISQVLDNGIRETSPTMNSENMEHMISPFPSDIMNTQFVDSDITTTGNMEEDVKDLNKEMYENDTEKNVSITNEKNTISTMSQTSTNGLYIVLILLIVWIILGIVGLITSIVCFGFSGTTVEKVLGVVIAMVLGPFYWLFFYFNKNYCGKSIKKD